MEALQRYCEGKGGKEIEIHELYSLADRIELAVTDTGGFFEQLNEAGDLLKKGGNKFAYNGALRIRNTNTSTQQQPVASAGAYNQHNQHSEQHNQHSQQQQGHERVAVAGKRGRVPDNATHYDYNDDDDDRFGW